MRRGFMQKIFLCSFFMVGFSVQCCAMEETSSSAATVSVEQCAQQNYRLGVEDGFAKGAKHGFAKGVEDGFAQGVKKGTDNGFTKGVEAAYPIGQLHGVFTGIAWISFLTTGMDAVGEFKRGKTAREQVLGAARTCAWGTAPVAFSKIVTGPNTTPEGAQSIALVTTLLHIGNLVRIGVKNWSLVKKSDEQKKLGLKIENSPLVLYGEDEIVSFYKRHPKLLQWVADLYIKNLQDQEYIERLESVVYPEGFASPENIDENRTSFKDASREWQRYHQSENTNQSKETYF